ncbi:O-antigen polymerase [Polynucleobacter sp. JS-Polo-80-F4]|uniref:O-antigen polymerase n=1 Tax=Polynucleobacter sp. JS-Polo-80-F4 TaxID=2576918 RepID=UPI001C0ACDD5|nr:O-antigen polymerase [Polynucleobacter sp. JS-Polo-80-F4]
MTWLIAISLEFIFDTNITLQPNITFIILLLLSMIIFIFIDNLYCIKYDRYRFPKIDKLISSNREIIILVIFLIGFIFSSFYFKFEYPFLKIFGLPYLEYNDYGIKGLQGLINACYLSLSTIFLYKIIFNDQKLRHSRLALILIFTYPFILLSRQLLFSLGIQIFLTWILLSKKSKLKLGSISILMLLIGLLFFWVMGNLRTGDEIITSFIDADADPSYAFLYWPYIYVVSPLSNLLLNINYSIPNGDVFTFLSQLVPSFIKSYYEIYAEFNGFEEVQLINPNLNMGTYFLAGYMSFGWLGMFISFSILLFLYAYIKKISGNNIYNFFCYIVIFQVVALSFFTNLLFYLPVVFQIFIFIYLGGDKSKI